MGRGGKGGKNTKLGAAFSFFLSLSLSLSPGDRPVRALEKAFELLKNNRHTHAQHISIFLQKIQRPVVAAV